jgi:Family of unknown function (DUF5995)
MVAGLNVDISISSNSWTAYGLGMASQTFGDLPDQSGQGADVSPSGVTVQDILARMHGIDDALPRGDGAAVFNHMYCTVTERVYAELSGGQVFLDPVFMEHLDVTFASLWLEAYDGPDDAKPKAWAPLFASRHDSSVLPIQFALAGMNSHIEHDLPVAVVRTCQDLGSSPHDDRVKADYEKVNGLLAECESEVRRSFLTQAALASDRVIGSVVHLISTWDMDKAREVAWVDAEAMWAIRDLGPLAARYEAALAGTVGMATRWLLTPVPPA